MNKAESKYFNTAVRLDKALLSLLEKKPFEYITIREICKEAGVNRSTFYLHYESICDLLHETIQYVLDGFVACFPKDVRDMPSAFNRCELQALNFIDPKYLYPYLNYIRENQRIFSAVLQNPSTFGHEAIFQRLFDNIFNPILDRFDYPDGDRKYVMMFYLHGLTALITEWLRDECRKSTEEIVKIICCCIFGK